MSKFLYPIYKLKTKSYIKWWLYHKKAGGSGILSEILTGTEFYLEDTVNRNFNLFQIYGRSVQDGTPTPENPISIKNTGDSGSINEKIQNKNYAKSFRQPTYNQYQDILDVEVPDINNLLGKTVTISFTSDKEGKIYENENVFAITITVPRNVIVCRNSLTLTFKDEIPTNVTTYTDGLLRIFKNYVSTNSCVFTDVQIEQGTTATDYTAHEEQNISIPCQQPMRAIGEYKDTFVKVDGNWYERHLPYIASYNGETLPQDVYNEVDNVKYCNEKSMSTTGQFSIGASVQYIDENNWNDLPCTEEQIQQLENKPSTYKDFTIINSEDETPAYLKIQYYKEG